MAGVWENIGIAFGAAAPVTVAYVFNEVRKWATRRRLVDAKVAPPLKALTSVDEKISSLLAEAGADLGAMRVYFSRFHNGDYFDPSAPAEPGSSIWRKTRTHEWVRPGVSYQSEEYRGMVVSSLTEEMRLVQADGPAWTRVDAIAPSKFHWLCERGGVTSVARCAVCKRPGKIIGFVGADFDADDLCEPPGVARLCDYAKIIQQLLVN